MILTRYKYGLVLDSKDTLEEDQYFGISKNNKNV